MQITYLFLNKCIFFIMYIKIIQKHGKKINSTSLNNSGTGRRLAAKTKHIIGDPPSAPARTAVPDRIEGTDKRVHRHQRRAPSSRSCPSPRNDQAT